MENDLLNEVKEGLKAHRGQWSRMAKEVPECSYSWIQQVGNGSYKSEPMYSRLQAAAKWIRAQTQSVPQ